MLKCFAILKMGSEISKAIAEPIQMRCTNFSKYVSNECDSECDSKCCKCHIITHDTEHEEDVSSKETT